MTAPLHRNFGLTGTAPDLTAEGIALMEQIHEECRINGEIVTDEKSFDHLHDCDYAETPSRPVSAGEILLGLAKIVGTIIAVVAFVVSAYLLLDLLAAAVQNAQGY